MVDEADELKSALKSSEKLENSKLYEHDEKQKTKKKHTGKAKLNSFFVEACMVVINHAQP